MSGKIISVTINKNSNYSNAQEIHFYSQNGYETCVMHDNVQSANVTGDRIVIISENMQHQRTMFIYDANTYAQIGVQPV